MMKTRLNMIAIMKMSASEADIHAVMHLMKNNSKRIKGHTPTKEIVRISWLSDELYHCT